MSMDINAEPGTKVAFHNPNSGYPYDQKRAAEYLELGEVYTVKMTRIDHWVTHVWLEEIPDVAFNSVMFED